MKDISSVIEFYNVLKNKYPSEQILPEKQEMLSGLIAKYGYLPYPYIKALCELSDSEVLFCLEKKLESEGVYSDGKFITDTISPLKRNSISNTDWIKREGHDIKLINLSGLGNGNSGQTKVSFFDWLRQIIILPTGNIDNNIFNTTIYLTPFHPRGFGCAYIPQASCVSPNLEDKTISTLTGLDADEQVKMFIYIAQLAGHPVIYDILPQTGRFSKTVLANPFCVRWFDVKYLIFKISSSLDSVFDQSGKKILSDNLLSKFSKDEIKSAIEVYKKLLNGESSIAISDKIKEIVNEIDNDEELIKYKKSLSFIMQNHANQLKIQAKVKNIICNYTGLNFDNVTENDIKDRKNIELELIKNGLWSLPGGAWNSSGVPVFDKMAKDALYPMMRHYNYLNEDVTQYANLDCQSPFYFVFLESGEYNNDVIDFYIKYVKNLALEFNFDGVRIDHVNHVVDELSVKDGVPISYRIPAEVLSKLNNELKSISPHFSVIAEYMLNQNYVKEYHQDMNFDLLYGNDLLYQYYKTPGNIDKNNVFIAEYNRTLKNKSRISVLKIYNNQDGEYKYINMYPAQLGKQGALFKWFKLKFLPGGYYASRPILYADGDESFSIGGLEETICNEVFMKRNDDMDFYLHFDAIDRFAKNNSIVCYGEAHILEQEDDGFVSWQIQTNDEKNFMIVAANYHSPHEYFMKDNFDPLDMEYRTGKEITDKQIKLSDGYAFVSEYKFNGKDYVEEEFDKQEQSLHFDKLNPAEFRFFRAVKL